MLGLGAAALVVLPAIVLMGAPNADGAFCAVNVSGPAVKAADIQLNQQQTSNARLIVQVVQQQKLPSRAAVIAIMTAMVESRMTNLDHGDRDSLGIFQQRPSAGWGTPQQIMDPIYSTNAFLHGVPGRGVPGLTDIQGWQAMPMGAAAQAVQVSAFPDRYADYQEFAIQLVGALTGESPPSLGVTCTNAVPAALAGPAVSTAINRAVSQLGVPYSWGGGDETGPTYGIQHGSGIRGFDCSGLMQFAWAPRARLPRVAVDQYEAGDHLPARQSAPGDMVFWARRGAIDHVAMVVANNGTHLTIVEAPRTGLNVRIRTLQFDETALLATATRVRAT
ncbi:NlpC/P60 family protein [Streptomyces sp. NPDC059193]|uniref:NlpC/P60 family protein n=1 Tax=Streptomyces sp. NPDC059193 TaxID=3346763 RepID=UPI0036CC1B01